MRYFVLNSTRHASEAGSTLQESSNDPGSRPILIAMVIVFHTLLKRR